LISERSAYIIELQPTRGRGVAVADTKEAEKTETKEPEKKTRPKLPEGYITPVEATNRLKKEVDPDTGKTYAHDQPNLSSQQMYTYLKAAPGNSCPVHHFDAEGHKHKDRVEKDGETVTRPGFKWEELVEWYKNRPKRGQKAKDEKKSEDAESEDGSDEAQDTSDELDEEDELAEDDDEDIVEAE
jgi:hypothetical protein